MPSTDAVEDNIYTPARETVNFIHEVEMLVIDRDTAQIANDRRTSG